MLTGRTKVTPAHKASATIMVLPASQRLWVAALVVMVQLPAFLQKCIFDEVQGQTRVVRAAPVHPDGPSMESKDGLKTGQQGKSIDKRAAPLHALSERQRKSRREEFLPTLVSPQPIRIHSWATQESSNLLEAEKERLEAAVQEAVSVVSSVLSVNRMSGPLLLSRDIDKYCKFLWKNSSTENYNRCGRANHNYRSETCLDVTIPDHHLAGCQIYPEADSPRNIELRPDGAGIPNTDFLLYLHIKTTDKCKAEPNVLAYAAHCQTDPHGRPVAGVMVICRDRLTGSVYLHQTTVQTVIHELFHMFGFSKHLFHTWRACSPTSTDFKTTQCFPRGKVTQSDGTGQMKIYTPSVISALQRHLASGDPELGGPLENLDVPPGRMSSHWESRVLQGSIMLAMLGDPTAVRIDAVTLAALQDTGWYRVNLSRAQSLIWGEGEGASFGSMSTCQNRTAAFFCSGSGSGCHYLHLHKGECKTDQYLEGCRVYKPLKNGSECWKEENAQMSADQDWRGQIFGLDSRCFFANLTRQFPTANSYVEGRCYRHRCTGPNSYQIQVSGSEWVDCPAGGTTQIKGYQGLVSCPEKRLCLYADVKPPSDDITAFPASITSDPYRTSSSGHNGTSMPPCAVAILIYVTAAVCLLAVVMASVRKWLSRGVRIHSAPEEPNEV